MVGEERATIALAGSVHPAHRKAFLTWNLLCGGEEEGTLNKGTEDVVLRGYSVRPQEALWMRPQGRVLVLSLKLGDSTDYKYEGPSGC